MVAVDATSAARQIHGDRRRPRGHRHFFAAAIRWMVVSATLLAWILGGGRWMTTMLQKERDEGKRDDTSKSSSDRGEETTTKTVVPMTANTSSSNSSNNNNHDDNHPASCPVTSISDLDDDVVNPKAGPGRWVVDPPSGGDLHLVCCHTTKGPLSLLLHASWAPVGVPHLLEMLSGGYFEHALPLFRCTDACQFGLSSDAAVTRRFDASIADDPPWLPTGPANRVVNGTARYPRGVLTHAGGGPDSRSNQFVLTLRPNRFMGGGSPWEVPMGEVVGSIEHNGDDVLDRLYTGYGERGPSQALLRRSGVTEEVKAQWPRMDYVLQCRLVDRRLAT